MSRDLHVDERPVFLLVAPGSGSQGIARPVAEMPNEFLDFIGRANLENRHLQEFVARITIVPASCLVDRQERKRLIPEDPHGLRIALEEKPVSLLGLPQVLLGPFTPLRVVDEALEVLDSA